MKRILCFLICTVLALSFASCRLVSGSYYAQGDYEEGLRPYVRLDVWDQTFHFGGGALMSYEEHGSFSLEDGKLLAKTQGATYIFEIKDNKTLVLTHDCEYPANMKADTQFAYSKDFR